MSNPRIALAKGTYGCGFGPSAHFAANPGSRFVTCGIITFVIDSCLPTEEVASQIRLAKGQGAIALVVDIVDSWDDAPLTGEQWNIVVSTCGDSQLVLVVDEAMTAVRCGASFAYQAQQFTQYGRPDLILFGEGVGVSGIAVDWEGIKISSLMLDILPASDAVIANWQWRLQ